MTAPCPFCGEARQVGAQEIDLGIWAVCCETCKTIGPPGYGPHPAAEAERKWDERERPGTSSTPASYFV